MDSGQIETSTRLALVSEGVFLPDGTFVALSTLATEPFLKLREQEFSGCP